MFPLTTRHWDGLSKLRTDWPHMTIAENVAFGLQMRKLAKDE